MYQDYMKKVQQQRWERQQVNTLSVIIKKEKIILLCFPLPHPLPPKNELKEMQREQFSKT